LFAKETVNRTSVSDHYAHSNLIAASHDGVVRMGKTTSTVTIDGAGAIQECTTVGRV
jgi:hypothetical protein